MSYSLSFSQSLYIVLFVASKVEQKQYEFISTQQIAEALTIPPSTAIVILRRLKKAGLIEAREGVNGGVRLAKGPEEITVLDIFDAVEQSGPMFPMVSHIPKNGEKSIRVQRAVTNLLSEAEEQMKKRLQSVTVKNLMQSISG